MPDLFLARLCPFRARRPGFTHALGLAFSISVTVAAILALLPSLARAQTQSAIAEVCKAPLAQPDAIVLDLLANEAEVLDRRLDDGDAELACLLQNLLSQRGFPLAIDGDFGPQSRRALANFKAVQCNDTDPNERLDRASLSCLIDDSKPLPFALAGAVPAQPSQPTQPPAPDTPAPATNTPALPAPLATPVPNPKPQLRTGADQATASTHLRRSSQVTGQPCRDPASSSDPDITRNLALFAASPLCYSLVPVEEAGRRWLVQVIENYENVSGPAWLAPHDNEDAGQNGGLWAVAKYGGFLITFEIGEQRIFQGQDANRIFGTTAQAVSACRNLRTPHPQLTNLIDGYFRMAPRPYLSLHSNTDGHGNGRGTISVLRKNSILQGHPARRGNGLADDEDNLIMTAGTTRFGENARALHFTSAMNHQGINVIYEDLSSGNNDCSFSNFVKLNRQGDYYTVEVEHGDDQRMRELIAALLRYLRLG